MKTFYSIVKIVPNPLSSENISIGLILGNGKDFTIKFSENKKKIAKSLLGKNLSSIEFIIEKFTNKLSEYQKQFEINQNDIIEYNSFLTSEYFQYLNKYSNNLIQFSDPKLINDIVSGESFEKLFHLFVDKNDIQLKKNIETESSNYTEFRNRINTNLIKRIKNKVHVNIELNEKVFPSLYFNYEMDCLGLNGSFIGAKSIHFGQSIETIKKQLSNYYALTTMLENSYDKRNDLNNYYIIADEPNNVETKEHKIWEHAKNLKNFKLIHSERVDDIAKKVEASKAKQFLKI